MSSDDPKNQTIKAAHVEFIRKLFQSKFDVVVENVTTIPRCNNNFVHFVTLESPIASDLVVSGKPGTIAIPARTAKVVCRIGNPAAMFNHTVKVENSVAMMQLTRQALSGLDIVPRVFAWSETGEPSGTGWILEEYMPGVDIESKFFTDVPREAQRFVLSQIATILKTVQDFELPPKASGFGGLAFDDSGAVTSGSFAVEPYNGPYPDMGSMYKGMLQAQLVEADRSRVAQGWKEDGLRDRLDAFAERGLGGILTKNLPEHVRPNLIIGDVVIANLLFDPDTYKVTALVDYDCSHTGHPLHEFFFSSFSVNYCVVSAESEVATALFDQFPSPLPESKPALGTELRDCSPPQWEIMFMFEEELEKVGAARPSSVQGAKQITEIYEFMSEICPFHFVMDRWVENQSEEKLQTCRIEQRVILEKALAKWGF
ncbi:hypothetical protein D6C91_03515 [Aureobasidium pullulans]|uniref:Aminoglycoside phosphotransferase domain-containing protein n=1 Tax=Aureobasidium pullulans TaxID=5580 RepID=A0A4S9THX2_AURPU|nr:hypothetical protein D6C91_03515 [Aureobasidium pullulans]